MAQSEGLAGSHSYALWAKETTYNTAVTADTHFSANLQSFRTRIVNNMSSNYGFSGADEVEGRKVLNFTAGVLELFGTAEIKITNFTWMENVLGAVSGSGPFTYVMAALPPSMTVVTDIDNPGSGATDQEITWSGGVVESLSLRSATGQPLSGTMELKFAKAVLDTALSSRVALPSETPYNFAFGSIELPTGSVIPNIIDTFDLTITNKYQMMSGHNSRLIQAAIPGGIELTIKATLKYLDNDLVTAALGATTPTATDGPTQYATIHLNYGNPDGDTFVVTFTRVPLSEFAQIHETGNPINEDISLSAGDISCVETLA